MSSSKNLKWTVLLSFLAVMLFPTYDIFVSAPSFTQSIMENSERDAVKLASHLRDALAGEWGPLGDPSIREGMQAEIDDIIHDFGLMKIKIFAPSGKILYSTDAKDVGVVNRKAYFQEQVAKGKTYTKVVKKDTRSLEDQVVTADVVETYVPVMEGDAFLGAFEIYYDITERKEKLVSLATRSHTAMIGIGLVLSALVVIASMKARRSIQER